MRKDNRFKNPYISTMQRLFFYSVILLLIFSCKPKEEEVIDNAVSAYAVESGTWPKRIAITPKATRALKDWEEFNALDSSFDVLYTVKNAEDLTLVIEELEVRQKAMAKLKFPKEFDVPQIKGRFTLFNTFLLKTKGDLFYRLDVQPSVLEMINAYNALREQFNITVNNTLDTKLILQE